MMRMPNEALLPFVNRPSRYLGAEINSIQKSLSEVDLHIALAFPELYEIGTSHLGISILYNILNKNERMYAERVFAPAADMERLLRENNAPLTSLETQTPLTCFDIIGFSLLYELNYTNILLMMDLAKIPFLACERDASYPFIIAGGPCVCNPEPVADFFDAMVVGDGERVIMDMSTHYIQWKQRGEPEKNTLLREWSKIQGVYIPSFYRVGPSCGEGNSTTPEANGFRIQRAVVEDLDSALFPEAPVVAFSNPVHDRLRLEISRGCTRGCRFCQAGMIYRPVRERSVDKLLELFKVSLKNTGYEDLSLLSLSTGDYSCIGELMERLMGENLYKPIAVSLPSVRAETITPKLMDLIRQVRKTGFTIAPEAGSQRLRDVINKNISEEDIVNAVTMALKMGWQGIKLYFMIGLPTETQQDISDIVALVQQLRKIRAENRRPFQISVSIATFIPKPHTPFQWARQISLDESWEKIQWLKEALRLPNVHVKWQNPDVSLLEGLWARGDRRLSGLLKKAYESGCRFDGWSDSFSFERWKKALADTRTDIDDYTSRKRSPDESLPWDHIDIGVSKRFLQEEWERAAAKTPTLDCRWGDCHGCGVCDFEKLSPRVYTKMPVTPFSPVCKPDGNKQEYMRLALTYAKENDARYLGHLEFGNLVLRAFRRADISVKYSEGFHPKPKISFQDPLPLGIEGLNEVLFATVNKIQAPEKVLKLLNDQMPRGVYFKKIEVVDPQKTTKEEGAATYGILLDKGVFDIGPLERFKAAEHFVYKQTNKKGQEKNTDLKKRIIDMALVAPDRLEISVAPADGKTIRPSDLLIAVFGMSEEQQKSVRVIKH